MRRWLPVLLVLLLVVVVLAARTRAAWAPPGPEAPLAPPGLETPLATPGPETPLATPAATTTVAVPTLGPATKSSGCQYRTAPSGAILPDTACTPGATNPELTREVLCAPGFSTRPYRRVTEAQKRSAYARYAVGAHAPGEYEIDHLVALEDGGGNAAANLWPQPASPEPGFHQKDLVETYVHRQVCAGAMDLLEAQQQIAADWTALLPHAIRANLAPKQHGEDGDESD